MRLANQMALAGLGFVAIAMSGAVLLVTSEILTPTAAASLTAGIGAVFLMLWLILPLQRRRTLRRQALSLQPVTHEQL